MNEFLAMQEEVDALNERLTKHGTIVCVVRDMVVGRLVKCGESILVGGGSYHNETSGHGKVRLQLFCFGKKNARSKSAVSGKGPQGLVAAKGRHRTRFVLTSQLNNSLMQK